MKNVQRSGIYPLQHKSAHYCFVTVKTLSIEVTTNTNIARMLPQGGEIDAMAEYPLCMMWFTPLHGLVGIMLASLLAAANQRPTVNCSFEVALGVLSRPDPRNNVFYRGISHLKN